MSPRHLVQLLLPLYDNAGQPLDAALFQRVRDELTERFGGLTAFTRAPAEGLWKEDDQKTQRDDVVVYEVMVEALEEAWWAGYRKRLEAAFRQEVVVIRAQEIRLL